MAFYDDPSGLTRYDAAVFYDTLPAPAFHKRMKITLNLSKKTILQIIDFAKLIKTKLTGNAAFPTPNPSIIALGTLITEAETANGAYETAKTTADEKLITRNLKMDALRAGIVKESSYVEDNAVTEADIESGGFTPSKTPSPVGPPGQVQNLSVTRNDADGALDSQWDPEADALKGYEVQLSVDPVTPTSWVTKDIVSQSNVTLTGLTSGTRVWIRVRGLGNKSQKGAWSNPVSKIVP